MGAPNQGTLVGGPAGGPHLLLLCHLLLLLLSHVILKFPSRAHFLLLPLLLQVTQVYQLPSLLNENCVGSCPNKVSKGSPLLLMLLPVLLPLVLLLRVLEQLFALVQFKWVR